MKQNGSRAGKKKERRCFYFTQWASVELKNLFWGVVTRQPARFCTIVSLSGKRGERQTQKNVIHLSKRANSRGDVWCAECASADLAELGVGGACRLGRDFSYRSAESQGEPAFWATTHPSKTPREPGTQWPAHTHKHTHTLAQRGHHK